MSSLSDRLHQRIQRDGPISFRDFMEAALYDEDAGYYCREQLPWGREGDYRTSPESSVLFAATFARYFATLFYKLGSPSELVLIEAGAGAGDFAVGVLETLRLRFPLVFEATRYFIDERSLTWRALLQERLERFGNRVEFSSIADLPLVPAGIIFSNELLDAFPVHRLMMKDGELREFFVESDAGGEFRWALLPPSDKRLKAHFGEAGIALFEGQIAEVNLAIEEWFKLASSKLKRGYVITVDYGVEAYELYSTSRPLGSLRAFRKHQVRESILDDPGFQDLTTTVNWTQVKRAGEAVELKTVELKRLDGFLMSEGLLEELEQRVVDATDNTERVQLRTSAREMILPGGMATSFQVLIQQKQ